MTAPTPDKPSLLDPPRHPSVHVHGAQRGEDPKPGLTARQPKSSDDFSQEADSAQENKPPSIYVLMGRVLADLPAVGKNQHFGSGSGVQYDFRGIEDVLAALKPVAARHGVFILPRVIERLTGERATRSGTTNVVWLHMGYKFCGPGGDFLEADMWGEATDAGDKATQKASTSAYKYTITQTFLVADEDAAANEIERQDAGGDSSRQAAPPRGNQGRPSGASGELIAQQQAKREAEERARVEAEAKAKEFGWDNVNTAKREHARLAAQWCALADELRKRADAECERAGLVGPDAKKTLHGWTKVNVDAMFAFIADLKAAAPPPGQSTPAGIAPEIMVMGKADLVEALVARKLSTAGDMAALQRRLADHVRLESTLEEPF